MAEMTSTGQHILRVDDHEFHLILKGLACLLAPDKVKIRGAEKQAVAALNSQLLKTSLDKLEERVRQTEKNLDTAREFEEEAKANNDR
jgi:hypothetical protein